MHTTGLDYHLSCIILSAWYYIFLIYRETKLAITAKDREHVIMGEAAMNLILRNEEVTVATLIRQLNAMSGDEPDGGRLATIRGACRWLLDFRQPGSLSQQGSPWFA